MNNVYTFVRYYLLIILGSPLFASAQAACQGQGCIQNPLGYTSITQFIELALRGFVLLALPVIAFFIVFAGFKFVLARGNPEQLAIAKWNFLYVIIGAVLILGAWVFATLIGATINSIAN